MRVVIADDERPARERLRRLLDRIPGIQVVAEAADGEGALEQIRAHAPDAAFLDIEMPGSDGMCLARACRDLHCVPRIVFITAYQQYAVEAFAVEAVDYLLKPVTLEELLRAVERLREPAEELQSPVREALHVTTGGSARRLPVASIAYFMADSKYVEAHHPDGVAVLDESLRVLESEFGAWFIRVHRKVLVRKDLIEGLERDSLGRHQLLLTGWDERLPVSRRFLPAVRDLLRGGTA